MAEGGSVCAVGLQPVPPVPSQAPRKARVLHWAFQSLTLASVLQHKLKQQVHLFPKQRSGTSVFSSAKQSHEDGNANAGKFVWPPVLSRGLTVRFLAIALFFGGPFCFFGALKSALPPDFPHRWRKFFEEQCQNRTLPGCTKRKMRSIIYDVHGEVITTVGAECEPCLSISHGKSSNIPTFLWQAVVACEDRRFFQHCGIDPRGVARAALSFSLNGGGSTITQQLVKNVFLTTERKWTRKLMEMVLALILETRMSKWDILHTYLKKIYWGHGVYGVESASDFYFGKHMSFLKVGECVMLAGMIPAPEFYSPFHDPSRGKRAQARALCRMVETGFLDTSYAEALINEPLELRCKGQDRNHLPCRAPYFVDEVLKDLKERYGCSKVLEGGLKVYTTLDLHMQELAEEVVKECVAQFDRQRINFAEMAIQQVNKKLEELQTECNIVIKKVISKIYSEQCSDQTHASKLVERAVARIEKKFSPRKQALLVSLQNFQEELGIAVDARLEAAIAAVDPLDGAVRVVVGGRAYLESCLNRATQAYRPPGSTFEPIIYLTALAERTSLKDTLRDQFFSQLANCSNHVSKMAGEASVFGVGPLSAPCVELCAKVGVDKVCRMGRLLGFEASIQHNPTVASGSCKAGVTPLQLATFYSTIAAGGSHHKPFFITRVETQDGEVLEEIKIPKAVEVVDEQTASELCKILQITLQQEMGQNSWMKRPCAGKTGTSEGHRDVWVAGFTPDISCVVWLGYDDNSCVGGLHPGTGVSHAIRIWSDFMNVAYKEQPIKYFKSQIGHKNAMKFPRNFLKAKRRLRFRKRLREKHNTTDDRPTWKDVWDWDKASSVCDERERMVEWTEKHLEELQRSVCARNFSHMKQAGEGSNMKIV